MQYIVLFGEVTDWQKETVHVLQICDQCAQRERTQQDSAATVPDNQGDRQGAEEIGNRAEQDEIAHGADRLLQVVAVQQVKLFVIALLTIKQLHNVHACDIFRDVSVDAREAHPDSAEIIAHSDAEIGSDPQKRWYDNKGHERELPVDDQ